MVSAFCAGLIGHAIEDANIINAEMLCRERGIEIVRKSSAEHGVFSSIISATVKGDGRTCHAAGTLFGKNMPRLVRLDEYRTETYLDGNLLIFNHTDVPGIIGYVGQVLAKENVNIAQMAVGRTGNQGGSAIGVLNLDAVTSTLTLERALENDGIQSVHLINLPAIGELPDWLI